ncbi:dihydroorotate dehydrogenase B catalytic subunit [Candidatus Roizmanbacteria bacterium CG11_big_fil_rev_8_21_14_0_20_37_16]|uniref:Dihydroorotate dehydrogenase n=1 Tax=Candidatus Roizmanbacteria bacterium CG11_big_fil_rev_8_21_14_0_20_37_16 TaxID=1974857 RepID=A0A2H0KJ65_9BACT|nr:MAG: dihydroorotate dehydrogenase B catalytic subunit [Candidatus Roizmanbacteria bacterium CG11_big_fil_rev_8_21_14_0_20_37_16]
MSLKIKLFNKRLKNPLFLPSGIINEIAGHKMAIDAGAGSVVLKSITINPREGNPIPRVAKYEYGIINSVGLRNPGLKEGKKQIKDFIKKTKTPVIISVFATTVKDFRKLVSETSELKPYAIEINLSCPNVEGEFGQMISNKSDSSQEVIEGVKKEAGKIPLIAKLTPNVDPISEVAKACEAAGADAIAAINTIAPSMIIDIKKRKPIIGMKKGGLSGPGIKPVAIAKIYEIYEVVKIPIIGMGGVEKWQDVVEMMMAGATLVGVGSAVYLRGYKIYQEILTGLEEFMKKEKINDIKKLIGIAH